MDAFAVLFALTVVITLPVVHCSDLHPLTVGAFTIR
jgi:hypothetical protein